MAHTGPGDSDIEVISDPCSLRWMVGRDTTQIYLTSGWQGQADADVKLARLTPPEFNCRRISKPLVGLLSPWLSERMFR